MFDHNDDDATRKEDRLAQGYDTILKESALLNPFCRYFVRFLLEISINTPKDFALGDKIILLLSLFLLP